jgi:hypothetical protein
MTPTALPRHRRLLRALGAIPPPVHVSLIALAAYGELHALGLLLVDDSVSDRSRTVAYWQAAAAGAAVLCLIWALLNRRTPVERESGGVAWTGVIIAAVAWIGLHVARVSAV